MAPSSTTSSTREVSRQSSAASISSETSNPFSRMIEKARTSSSSARPGTPSSRTSSSSSHSSSKSSYKAPPRPYVRESFSDCGRHTNQWLLNGFSVRETVKNAMPRKE